MLDNTARSTIGPDHVTKNILESLFSSKIRLIKTEAYILNERSTLVRPVLRCLSSLGLGPHFLYVRSYEEM